MQRILKSCLRQRREEQGLWQLGEKPVKGNQRGLESHLR